jgi:hypothetical protein
VHPSFRDDVVRAVVDHVPRRAVRLLTDENPVRRRRRLHPRGGVDDVAGDHRLAGFRTRVERDDRLAGVDRDAHLDVARLDRPVADRERCAHGAFRVVLACDRRAVHGHHCIADELLDRPAEALQLGAEPVVIRDEDVAHVFGIEVLGARREADEVGEEHGDHLPFLPRGHAYADASSSASARRTKRVARTDRKNSSAGSSWASASGRRPSAACRSAA